MSVIMATNERSIPVGYHRKSAFKDKLKVISDSGKEESDSPDEVCDLICEHVCEQFWDWWNDPTRQYRFKPYVKVYEVLR